MYIALPYFGRAFLWVLFNIPGWYVYLFVYSPMTLKVDKNLKKRIAAVCILMLIICLLMWLAGYPRIVEKYYSRGIYQFICMVLHPIFNLFPFSVGDLLYILAVIMLIAGIVNIIIKAFKKQFVKVLKTLLHLVIGIEAGIVIFYFFWGMNYYRLPAAIRLDLKDTVYSMDQLKNVTLMLIDSTNATRDRLMAADLQQGNDSVYSNAIAAVKALSATSGNYSVHSPKVKPSLLTPVINYLSTSGYYNPFTAEAQINYSMPLQLRPFVACHELSHQMGFGPEDEASFAGFIAGIHSRDRLLRYSAYYSGMTEFMYALRGVDSLAFKQYKKRISDKVRTDLKAEHAYWEYYEGRLEVMSGFFYDKFLKANNQPQGLLTYNQMITLVMAWYNKPHNDNKQSLLRNNVAHFRKR